MMYVQRGLYGVLCGLLVLAIAGCGGGERLVTVTGKLVDGGQPIAFEDLEGANPEAIEEMGEAPVEVEFWPVDEAGNIDRDRKPTGASVDLDGTFVVSGLEGEGIPAGRYRVALLYTAGMDAGMGEATEGGGIPAPWGNKFTAENSPWTYNFTGDQEITLDIAAAGGAESAEPESAESEA